MGSSDTILLPVHRWFLSLDSPIMAHKMMPGLTCHIYC